MHESLRITSAMRVDVRITSATMEEVSARATSESCQAASIVFIVLIVVIVTAFG